MGLVSCEGEEGRSVQACCPGMWSPLFTDAWVGGSFLSPWWIDRWLSFPVRLYLFFPLCTSGSVAKFTFFNFLNKNTSPAGFTPILMVLL